MRGYADGGTLLTLSTCRSARLPAYDLVADRCNPVAVTVESD